MQDLDERSGGPVVPAAILPAQFFTDLRHKVRLDGERRLMIAILEDAVHCFQKQMRAKDAHGQRLFADAEEWINGDDRTWFFSFENVCHALEIDPDYLREGLRAWKEATIHGRPVARGATELREVSGG